MPTIINVHISVLSRRAPSLPDYISPKREMVTLRTGWIMVREPWGRITELTSCFSDSKNLGQEIFPQHTVHQSGHPPCVPTNVVRKWWVRKGYSNSVRWEGLFVTSPSETMHSHAWPPRKRGNSIKHLQWGLSIHLCTSSVGPGMGNGLNYIYEPPLLANSRSLLWALC